MGDGITLNQSQSGVYGLDKVLSQSSRKPRKIGEFPILHGKNTTEYLIGDRRGDKRSGSSVSAIKNNKTGSTVYTYTVTNCNPKEKGNFKSSLVNVTAYDDNGDGNIDRYVATDIKQDPNSNRKNDYITYDRYFVNDSNNGYGDGKAHFKEVKELPKSQPNYAWYDPRGWFE